MEILLLLFLIIGVLTLLYILGRQTLIDWSREDEYEPTIKEVILFVILFMIAQKALMDSFKKNTK